MLTFSGVLASASKRSIPSDGLEGKMSPREALLDQGGYLVGTDNTVAKNGFLGVELCFCKLHQVLNICYENCFPRSALSGNGSEPDFISKFLAQRRA